MHKVSFSGGGSEWKTANRRYKQKHKIAAINYKSSQSDRRGVWCVPYSECKAYYEENVIISTLIAKASFPITCENLTLRARSYMNLKIVLCQR